MHPIVCLSDPRALPAATVAALGLVDITLGVVAPRSTPTIFWPLTALGATGTTLVCGLALLLLARSLTRGLRAAWMLTIALRVPAALAAPVAGRGRRRWSARAQAA